MLPWGRRRLVRVQSQVLGSQSAERLSLAGAYSEDDRRAYASRSATAAPSQLGYDPVMAAEAPVMLVNVEVLDDDNRPPQARYSEPLGVERSERERVERMERLERLEREEEPRWKRPVEQRPAAMTPPPAMSPIAAASPPPPPAQFLRPPFGVASPGGSRARLGGMSPAGSFARLPMGAVSPAGSRPRLMSPISPRSPSRQFLYGGPPLVRPSSSGRLTPMTPRSGSRSPSWPFMTDRQVIAARQYRRERHNLLEWIMTWVFVVTLAVVLLAILVFYASWQTRLDKKMQEHIYLLQKLSQAPRFESGLFQELHKIDLPTEVHLRTLLKTISEKRYIAGTETKSAVTEYVNMFMIDNKINRTKIATYVVTLSHPIQRDPNSVVLTDANYNVLMKFELDEPPHLGNDVQIYPAYSAYGRAGSTTGQVFYANRCFPEDLDALTIPAGINSAVLLCHYVQTEGPGFAVATAQKYQAAGVLLFAHPQDIATADKLNVYPRSWWMSDEAIRRAHVRRSEDTGDPTTPGYASRYPSTSLYREQLDDTMLPKIPVQPINYRNATAVLDKLAKAPGGIQCPSSWPSVPLGAQCKMSAGTTSLLVKMDIHNEIHLSNIQNILAVFPGDAEPDRYVVFGVPLDSWGGGAVAPGSALAQALGLCYIINKQCTRKNNAWRPRRTILFAGWDAHEFGNVGVTEFLEGTRHKIASRTVVYLNSDVCTTGPQMAVTGSPVFSKSFKEATKWVRHSKNVTLFNAWYNDLRARSGESGQPELPMLRKQGGFLPFVDLTGVPSLDVAFKNQDTEGIYFPAMGTSYDTVEITDKFIDPTYQVHKRCRELLLALIWQWSEAVLLPYDLKELGARLSQEFNELNVLYKHVLDSFHLNLETLSAAVKMFTSQLSYFEGDLSRIDMKNPLEVRRYNDKMMAVERCFIQEAGKKMGPAKLRNVVYGPSDTDHEKLVAYPALRDALEDCRATVPGGDRLPLQSELKRQISLAVYALMQAVRFMEHDGLI